jgi:hypothetical protein
LIACHTAFNTTCITSSFSGRIHSVFLQSCFVGLCCRCDGDNSGVVSVALLVFV